MAWRSDDYGGALFGAIIVVFLLSLLAVGILSLTLGARKTAETQVSGMSDQLLAESAIDIFLNQTLLASTQATIQEGELTFAGEVVQLSVEYERGKINLNRANFSLLSAAFAANGMSTVEARKLAGAIIDWRDRDTDPFGDYGAELSTYETAGLKYGPRNGPFESVGELVHVLGADSAPLGCIASLATVSSDTSLVDTTLASEDVQRIFEWAVANDWDDLSGSVLADDNEVSGQAVTITAQFGDDSEKKFQAKFRIKSTADRSYEQLSPVRRVVAFQVPCL